MAATATRPTVCPNCGVKLPDIPISLCAYCAMPIGIEEAQDEGVESPNAGRIQRIQAHDKYAAALEFQPPEDPATLRGSQLMWRSKLLIVGGVLALALGLWSYSGVEGFRRFLNLWTVLGVAAIGFGIRLGSQGAAMRSAALAAPLMKRPGIITDRRSETNIRGWYGDTTYHFTIEFEGGVIGEFSYAGRGSNADPYVSNLPGVAYTRGPRLLHFMHIRV